MMISSDKLLPPTHPVFHLAMPCFNLRTHVTQVRIFFFLLIFGEETEKEEKAE